MSSRELNFVKEYRYSIYIGLTDRDSYEEYFTYDQIRDKIVEYSKGQQIAFSLGNLYGGYAHDKGYTTEHSLKIIMVGAKYETVLRLAEYFKKAINTDTVLVGREVVENAFV